MTQERGSFTAWIAFSAIALGAFTLSAQNLQTYQRPSTVMARLLDAPPTPLLSLSPDGKTIVIEQPYGYPRIEDLARPEDRLAGSRFNPETDGPSRGPWITSLRLLNTTDTVRWRSGGVAVKGIVGQPHITHVQWSPDGKRIAFTETVESGPAVGLYLDLIDVSTAIAHRVPGIRLSNPFGNNAGSTHSACEWMSNSLALLCRTVPDRRPMLPPHSPVPSGPTIEENLGKATPGRTYEDLLKSPEDERIFDYYATAQLRIVPVAGSARLVGKPAVITATTASPNGRYVLIIECHHPYSYEFPVENFPERALVVDLTTHSERQLSDRPLADRIPIAFDAVAPGPRDYEWRADAPATVAWVEAGDGGDPRRNVAVHDRIVTLQAPFTGTPSVLAELPMRFVAVYWGKKDTALVLERRRKDRQRATLLVNPGHPGQVRILSEGSSEDIYHAPGIPLTAENRYGKEALHFTADAQGVYVQGLGASPEGDRPFVSVLSLADGTEKQIFRSQAPYYEDPLDLLSPDKLLIRRESHTDPPNYFLVDLSASARDPEQVTFFANPYGDVALPSEQILHYERADGVDLSANLYLPPGYSKEQGPLPTIMEAYPTEYKTRSAAGQMRGSPYRFPRFNWGSPIFFATDGFAVLENASIPILGEGRQEPNDTYVEQLVASAKAAIDYGASMGVVDPKRVGVMGHSYGAFMTANLLAHSDIFRAGVARSGAYNRTLTPFGFQNEERTYWQDPKLYYDMSPFSFADKIHAPILLVHGQADDNQGTFPIQSERFFAALKGEGATVRFVLLPLEAHGYQGNESLLDLLWEESRWFNMYVKPEHLVTAPAQAGSTPIPGGTEDRR
ncbi:MAG: alpha/beta hydrolase family protein [Acidobacteriota bacterium]